ncbi:MAG TPA: hypothetical protein VIW46_04385 [Acidimicrobiia bacterium]
MSFTRLQTIQQGRGGLIRRSQAHRGAGCVRIPLASDGRHVELEPRDGGLVDEARVTGSPLGDLAAEDRLERAGVGGCDRRAGLLEAVQQAGPGTVIGRRAPIESQSLELDQQQRCRRALIGSHAHPVGGTRRGQGSIRQMLSRISG